MTCLWRCFRRVLLWLICRLSKGNWNIDVDHQHKFELLVKNSENVIVEWNGMKSYLRYVVDFVVTATKIPQKLEVATNRVFLETIM